LAVMLVMVMVFWAVINEPDGEAEATLTPVAEFTATETATLTATPTTPTPTTTPETPTSTLTAAPTPTSTTTPTPIPTFTLTPTPTATSTATHTPTPMPTVISPWKPDKGVPISGLVTFEWTWSGMLGPGEVFDVKVCKGEDCLPQYGIANPTDTSYTWCPAYGAGVYRWQVVVIDSVTMQPIGPASEVWEFTWEGGCGLPSPTPTPVPTPTPPSITLLEPANGARVSGLVTFRWIWPGGMRQGETLDVKVCKGGGCQPQFGKTNTWATTWAWCPDEGEGIYRWLVEVIDDVTKQPKGPTSEVWEFA